MAPKPQVLLTEKDVPSRNFSRPPRGDEIVISGIAGLFPKSESTVDLMENLYNKVDMVEEVKYNFVEHPNLPRHQGKVKNLNKFDAQFFRVTHWQANSLDPMSRKLMECAFSAIYDSGINPISLGGTKLGVFVGSSFSDTVTMNLFDYFKRNAFIISGSSKTMLANRISYWIDGKGPSFGVDQACTSSMACLELAYNSIKRGDCDSALVGGCSSCVHPLLCVNLKLAGLLCLDGKTKCFDKNGDGYVRSEAINILFLQKAKDAKRIYTEIYHIKSKFFMQPDVKFLPMRRSKDIENFLHEFYSELGISPSEVEYVEAFGSGIAEADDNEVNAIGNIFAKSRSIKIGSIKSNMGHTEAANGVCAVTKMCLAYHKGQLPGNLHYSEPQDHIPAIREGRVQVVTENTDFTRDYSAINSNSYTGANYHVLLKGYYKNKDKTRYKSNIPRLILLSGRDDNGLNTVMDMLSKQLVDPEQIALLHNIYKQDFGGHTGRSYIVLDTNEKNETVCLARSFEFYSGTARQICFMYSGMGSQWCGMGVELMRIPIFAAAIERCQKVLNPLGVDVIQILSDPDKSTFDSILNSMIGICAVQIGLTDVLKEMGIEPDYIIGHSLGELGCAYADGCFTTKEAILSSYIRGLVSIQTPFIKGSMAAIGLGYKDILPLCPPDIEIACHNSAESSTISGPSDVMNQFVSDLMKREIFAKEVSCSNIAFHSKYISEAGPSLLSKMQELIKEPKLRSLKWISTSLLQENWDQDCAKYASPEYFTNNLLNPVYFEESASLIPKDAIIIEIAPHGLLQSIVKTSHKNCVNIPLTKRGSSDPVTFLFEAFGKLYQNGKNSQVDILYPKVEFPVSIETPMLSHLVKWEHSINWPEMIHNRREAIETSERNFVLCIHDDDYKFLEGHVRNGVNEFPESALLVLVWETFGMYKGKYYKDMSVTFSDIIFHCQLKLETEDVTRLKLMIHSGSSWFELTNFNTPVVTGFITDEVNAVPDKNEMESNNESDILNLRENDIYALLYMRGYSYSGDFQSIHSLRASEALVKWTGEWTTYIDSLLQYSALFRDHDGVSVPKIIQQLTINVDRHKNNDLTIVDGFTCYRTEMLKSNVAVRCGGVDLEGVSFEDIPKIEQQPDVLLSHEFIPHFPRGHVDFETAISVNLQIVAENIVKEKVKVLEIVTSLSRSIFDVVTETAVKIPACNFEIGSIDIDQLNVKEVVDTNLFIVKNLLKDKKINKLLLKKYTFVLTLEESDNFDRINNLSMEIVTMMQTQKGILLLLKNTGDYGKEDVLYLPLGKESNFSWLPRIQTEMKNSRRVLLVSERQTNCGLFGFVKNLQKSKGNKIGLIIINDYLTTPFTPENDMYKAQLQKSLTFNVLNEGQWGSYYYIPNSRSFKIPRVRLTSNTFKDLDSFAWTEKPVSSQENVVQVSYASLSIRDCHKALGNIKDKSTSFGMDFSGINSKDQRVMGMVADGALGSTVEADTALLWPVPDHWSLEDAATVPRPYIQAYYCLVIKGKIQRNQTVFVTGGSGALGQAVISVCLSLDCNVLTSVRNENKKIFLLQLFPKLKEENIILSSHDFFFAGIINLTKNRKCKIVINCYNGLRRHSSMKCVGFMSTFLDVSDIDIIDNDKFGMFYLTQCKSYVAVNLSSLFKPENYTEKKVIQMLVAEGIKNGTVRPLSRVVYPPTEISRAFRFLSTSKHIGRVLIKMNFTGLLKVTPRICLSKGVFVVLCDRTNLGVELIDHLVRRGAKKILINFNPDYNTSYLKTKSISWKKENVKIDINSDNVRTKDGCRKLLKAGHKMGLISGIFIVQEYKEGLSDYIEESDFKTVVYETVLVADNLDTVSKYMCHGLSHFVHISVTSDNIGSEYATSACAKILEARKQIGLPALFLRCEVPKGNKNNNSFISKLGLTTISALFSAMDISLKYNNNNVFSLNLPKLDHFNYVQKLERLLGVKTIEGIDENMTINEICKNEEEIKEIKTELESITDCLQDLGKMRLGSLKKICKSYERKNTNFDAGLGAFYNYIEKDEYAAVDAVIPMNTHFTSFEEDGYLDRNETHLMMIPGFEGHYRIFKNVAERIKIRAATLQLGPDLNHESISAIAKTLSNLIKTNFKTSSKFYILGYSFGVNIALETAKLLENEGQTGVVYCLDSSPDALKAQINAYTSNLTGKELETSVLEHMYKLINRDEDDGLKQELGKLDGWNDKVEFCVKRLRRSVSFSSEYIRNMLHTAYGRIILAKDYEPDFKLKSEIVLIRAISHPKANLSNDYNLSKYTTEKIKIFDIKSDHVSAPDDCRVSNIVNKMLDPKILEDFNKKNLCNIYYIRSEEQ